MPFTRLLCNQCYQRLFNTSVFLTISSKLARTSNEELKYDLSNYIAGVGKSCLLLQFTDKRFQPVHDLTIGMHLGFGILIERHIRAYLDYEHIGRSPYSVLVCHTYVPG